MAPVRNSPSGTTTRPPPLSAQASIARAIASAQSVLPSATAPNFVMTKSRRGNFGAWMRFKIRASSAHALFVFDAEDAARTGCAAVNRTRRMAKLFLMVIFGGSFQAFNLCVLRNDRRAFGGVDLRVSELNAIRVAHRHSFRS